LKLHRKKIVGWLVLLAAGLWMLPRGASAAESSTGNKKAAPKKVSKAPLNRKSSRRHASRRRSSYRYRLAKLQPEPGRIQEIQQALIREGYLKQEATGKWDDATRAAMRNYQQANGLEVTGLPEAKALMKLGLGPHPLPEDADPSVVGSAQVTTPPKTGPPASGATAQPSPNNPQ
jgi:peptidoglycan hydrolase-like protein with peptidoglycan-binding domain